MNYSLHCGGDVGKFTIGLSETSPFVITFSKLKIIAEVK